MSSLSCDVIYCLLHIHGVLFLFDLHTLVIMKKNCNVPLHSTPTFNKRYQIIKGGDGNFFNIKKIISNLPTNCNICKYTLKILPFDSVFVFNRGWWLDSMKKSNEFFYNINKYL